jgi:regulator of protease activity HflC (stomatin/prohibitin superfamily)
MITQCIFVGIIGIILLIASKGLKTEGKVTKKGLAIAGWVCNGLALIFFVFSLFYIVNPGKVGVEILFGKVTKYAPSGLNFKNPFAEIVIMDLQTIKYETKLEGASKDLQEIGVDIAINYRLDYKRIEDLYNNVGKDYEVKVIQPAVMNIAKAAISQFPINDVIVKRNDLMQAIFDALKARLDQYYIILETVNLNNITFAEAFTKAV